VPDDVEILVETFGQFLAQHAQNISEGGMFLRSAAPAPPGARLSFAIRLTDGYTLVRGVGEVMWTREPGDDPGKPPGMGIRFVELEESGRELIRKLVEERRRRRAEGRPPTVPMRLQVRRSSPTPPRTVVQVAGPEEPFETPGGDTAAAGLLPGTGPFAVPASDTDTGTATGPVTDTDTATDTVTDTDSDTGTGKDTASPSGERGSVRPPSGNGWSQEELPEIGLPADYYDSEPPPPPPPSRGLGFWLFAIPVGVLAVAALLYGAWRQGLLPVPGERSQETTAPRAASTRPAEEGSTRLPTPAADVERPEAPPATASPTEGPEPPAAAPSPPPTTAAPPPTVRPATGIRAIRHRTADGGTEVLIEGDGPIAGSRVRLTMLENPPRALVRIRGIRRPYEPTVTHVGSPAVSRIRVWLHGELTPPELYVVLDLPRPGIHARATLRNGTIVITVR